MSNVNEMMFEMDDSNDFSTTPDTASSAMSMISSKSNPFFAGLSYTKPLEIPKLDEVEHGPQTPTTYQKNLCINATSEVDPHLSDDDDEEPETEAQKKLCLCATSIPMETQESGLLQKKSAASFPSHFHQITDDYTVSHEILGIGESGKVMACYSKKDSTKYALKVLRDSPKARREVELHYLASNHENIVKIIDIYENTFDGLKCLLMVCEYLEGGDLLTIFENNGSVPYSEKQVGEILKQIGSAVEFLHDMNIAHRDIKLENILCSSADPETCIYKLGDFGFAKRPERNHLMESPCCTPYYVAPEVLGREKYDKSCDMWSLGVAIYILLCGYPPFYSMKGLAFSPGMKTRITTGLYAFPAPEWDNVSESTKDEIRHLLKTDPATRTTIHELMRSSLVTGEVSIPVYAISNVSDSDSADSALDINMHSGESTPEPDDQGDISPRSWSRSITPEDEVPELPSKSGPAIINFKKLEAIAQQVNKMNQFASVRQFSKPSTIKPPRLHSIQEEVGRALDMMRLGGEDCFIKSPKIATNPILERRRSHMDHESSPESFKN